MLNFPNRLVINGAEWNDRQFKFDVNCINCKTEPTWRDVVISGTMSLTLLNAKADSLLSLKLFGGTEQLSETYLDTVTAEGKCVQNGTPTPTNPVDIVCNNGVIKYGVYSTNIFDVATMDTGRGWYISNGLTSDGTPNRTIVIDCKPNTKYSWWHCNGAGGNRAFTLDTDTISGGMAASWLTGATPTWTAQNVVTTVTTSASAKKLYICAGRTEPNISRSFNEQLADFMVVEGEVTTALPYESYKSGLYVDGTVETVTDSNGLTATCERLLSVGSYKDTQEILSGVVTRNSKILVLDGTENWIGKTVGGANRYQITIADARQTAFYYLKVTHGTSSSDTSGNVWSLRNGGILCFYYDAQLFPTSTDFANWLATQYANGTPVIVVYPLETSTTESVSPQGLAKSPVTATGSLSDLVVTAVSSTHTTPTPTQPLQINCNNGVLKVNNQGNIYTDGTVETVEVDTTGDTATAENLLKIGTYQDVQSVLDGEVTRNVGIKVLDGTEDWSIISSTFAIPLASTTSSSLASDTIITSSHFRGVSSGTPVANMSNLSCKVANSTGLGNKYALFIKYNAMTTTTDFKTFLADQYNAGTPVIVVYSLATPTTEYIYNPNAFTLTGTPTITSKGVASNFGENDYLSTGTISALQNATDFGISVSGTIGSTSGYGFVFTDANGADRGVCIMQDGTNLKFRCNEAASATTLSTVAQNDTFKINITTKNTTTARVICYVNGVEKYNNNISIATMQAWGTSLYIGNRATDRVNSAFDGSINLSEFKILVNKNIVFNGAKTQSLTLQEGTNIVEITQASMNNLELEVSYKAGVTVTVEEIEAAQLDDDVEVTIS